MGRRCDLRCFKSRSQNPLALLCDLAVLVVLSAVTRLARTASLGFVSDSNGLAAERAVIIFYCVVFYSVRPTAAATPRSELISVVSSCGVSA